MIEQIINYFLQYWPTGAQLLKIEHPDIQVLMQHTYSHLVKQLPFLVAGFVLNALLYIPPI